MATLPKGGIEPVFHGISLPGSGYDLCANFREGPNVMTLSTSLDTEGAGLT